MEHQFIKLYRNVLPPTLCSDIIDTYEKLWREQEDQIKKMSLCYNTEGEKVCGACNCQRLDIMQHHEFREPFKPRRGRINCSLNDNGKWRWFGVQFPIKEN